MLHTVRSIPNIQSNVSANASAVDLGSNSGPLIGIRAGTETHAWNGHDSFQQQPQVSDYDWFGPHPESTATSPAASTGVAALQWLGLVTRDAFAEVEGTDAPTLEGGHLDPFDGHAGNATTPLQQATKIVDDQPSEQTPVRGDNEEEALWQAHQGIVLLEHEQTLFAHFVNRICSWVCPSACSVIDNFLT